MTGLEGRMTGLEGRMTGLEDHMTALEEDVEILKENSAGTRAGVEQLAAWANDPALHRPTLDEWTYQQAQ